MFSPRRTRLVLVAVLVLAAGGGLLALSSGGALTDGLHRLDRAVLLALREDGVDPLGPPWIEGAVRDLTALGGVTVLAVMTAAVALFLALDGRPRAALHAVLVFAGSGILVQLLKPAFARARPEVVPHVLQAMGWSFPSGHSLMSTATFLTLGALLGAGPARRAVRLYFLGLGATLAFAVGASRVYLGVHWPTDVVAGWLAGAAWAALCWRAGLRLGVEGRPADR